MCGTYPHPLCGGPWPPTSKDASREIDHPYGLMQRTQPNYSKQDLAKISVPVRIVQSERDEFIQREHADYLAKAIPGASLILLHGVSHFAPLQRPQQFNTTMLEFVDEVLPAAAGMKG